MKFKNIFAFAILTASFHPIFANDAAFDLGQGVKVFAKKAYRKNQGQLFEAVGNVVIINGKDTLYGEMASYDMTKGEFVISGNVRLVSSMVNLYGTKMTYQTDSKLVVVYNAKIANPDYSVLAKKIVRLSEDRFEATEAEYTTCHDCPEAWSISGDKALVVTNQYVLMNGALIKVKSIPMVYLPVMRLPLKKERETGFLFPRFSTRLSEGMALETPWFWAIDKSKDMTITPTFWAIRGYGGDVEYRHVFGEKKWINWNTRYVNDKIYLPNKLNRDPSETSFNRYFTDLEGHFQWSNNFSSHFKTQKTRDLDFVRDYPMFTDEKMMGSETVNIFSTDYRTSRWTVSGEANYSRNLLVADPMQFDDRYVQNLPRLSVSLLPQTLLRNDSNFLPMTQFGFNSSSNIFKQNVVDESVYLRNATRLDVRPFIKTQLYNNGRHMLGMRLDHERQFYHFRDSNQQGFEKHANILTTEFSFSLEKIWGLAYEEKIPIEELTPEEKIRWEKLQEQQKKDLKPLIETKQNGGRLVGTPMNFDESTSKESLSVNHPSYRHRQEFKVQHYLLFGDGTRGNEQFRQQINKSGGWFDYNDAIKRDEYKLGGNLTRTALPLINTLELQWNNSLLNKKPRGKIDFEDNKYIRDHFSYGQTGYFNVSQGLNMASDDYSKRNRLSRLGVETGYYMNRWQLGVNEYYYHTTRDHIVGLSVRRGFDLLDVFATLNVNTLNNIKTLSQGAILRPIDHVRLRLYQERDLVTSKVIINNYQLEYLSSSQCWLLGLNYRKSVVDARITFDLQFNFGGEKLASRPLF